MRDGISGLAAQRRAGRKHSAPRAGSIAARGATDGETDLLAGLSDWTELGRRVARIAARCCERELAMREVCPAALASPTETEEPA